jgi:hypothetical protein
MTPFVAWLKRTRERWAGVYNEGPEPPQRLAQHVVIFAQAHPRATVAEWAAFASNHAAESYRAGYARGYEWSAREDMSAEKVTESERLAEEMRHAFTFDGVPMTVDDQAVVPEERDELAERTEAFNEHNQSSIEYELDHRALGPSR